MKRTCNFVIGSLVWDTQWRGWEHQLLSTSATFCHYIWFAIYKNIYSAFTWLPFRWVENYIDAFTHVDVLFVLWTCLVSKSTHLMIQVVWYITHVILLTFVRIISWISRIDDYLGPTKKSTIWERFWWLDNPWQQWLRVCFDDLGLGQLVFLKLHIPDICIYIYRLSCFFNSRHVKYNTNWSYPLLLVVLNLLIPLVHGGHRIRDLHSEKEYEAVDWVSGKGLQTSRMPRVRERINTKLTQHRLFDGDFFED